MGQNILKWLGVVAAAANGQRRASDQTPPSLTG